MQAGLTYNVNDNLKIDFSWRYLNLGSPQTGVVVCQNTGTCPGAFYTLHDLRRRISASVCAGCSRLAVASDCSPWHRPPLRRNTLVPQPDTCPRRPEYAPQPHYTPPRHPSRPAAEAPR